MVQSMLHSGASTERLWYTISVLHTCIRRLEAVIAAVASDLDRWWVFFVGAVSVAPDPAEDAGEGEECDPATPEGLKGDLLTVNILMYHNSMAAQRISVLHIQKSRGKFL